MVTGSLTFASQSLLVTPWVGKPCSERAVLSCKGCCSGSTFFTSTLPSPMLMAAPAVTARFGFCIPFL